ncbi:MAG TPA: hypothetical protein HPP56_05295 [Nitrospirae bacterium]|nr:hypothetical protein [Nitrospirota bacterium]
MQCLLLRFLKISFIRCLIKILHQPFLSYLQILLSFLVLSPILGYTAIELIAIFGLRGF